MRTDGRAIVLLAGVLAGCARIEPRAGFDAVDAMVTTRSPGRTVVWDQGTPEDELARRRVDELLARELTIDDAVQVALLRNRSLQAVFGQLGIAQADLVQAGLPPNPVLAADVRFGEAGMGVGANLGMMQELLAIVQIPLKRRVAAAAFDEATLVVSAAVVDLVMTVKRAFYRLQGAEQTLVLRRTVVDALALGVDVVRRQHDAGNTTDLALVTELALHAHARADLAHAEIEVTERREELTALMGLWGAETAWRIAPRLPALPADEIAPEGLETLAVTQRLDLAAARQRVQLALQQRELTHFYRLLPAVGVGPEAEREVEGGVWSVGPAIELPIPLFDQRQATLASDATKLAQREHEHAALAIAIRSEVRKARARMATARALADEYRAVLLPLRERVLRQTQLEYNAMLIGVFQLLAAKREQVETARAWVEALRDYWVARTELESALGGELPFARAPSPADDPLAPPTAPAPHHHRHHGG